MKKSFGKLFAMSLAVLMLLTLAACGGSGKNSTSEKTEAPAESSESSGERTFTASGETLNVGVQSNIISIPTVYAYEHGYYEELGLDVNLIMFPNGSPENEGLAAEQLDLASNGLACTPWPPACVTGSASPTAVPPHWPFICAPTATP